MVKTFSSGNKLLFWYTASTVAKLTFGPKQNFGVKIGSNSKLYHWKGAQKELFISDWCHSGISGYVQF